MQTEELTTGTCVECGLMNIICDQLERGGICVIMEGSLGEPAITGLTPRDAEALKMCIESGGFRK